MDARRKSHAEVDRRRNAEVLRDLLDISEPVLRRQARKHAELAADAEEALQSAFALFIERYRGDCDPLAWLQTTVKREAWRIARKASRRWELSSDDLRFWIERERRASDGSVVTARTATTATSPKIERWSPLETPHVTRNMVSPGPLLV